MAEATEVFALMQKSLGKAAKRYLKTQPSAAIVFTFGGDLKGFIVVAGDWDLTTLEWYKNNMEGNQSFGVPCHLYLSSTERADGRIVLFVNPQLSLEERKRLLFQIITGTTWLYQD